MIRKLALSVLFLTAIAASPFVAPVSAIAQAGHDQQVLIDKAARVVAPMRADPNFTYSGKLLARAKAVMIVPELTKGGFILGGQGGAAVLVAKRPDGSWSDPAFYSLGGGTLGLQIGVQQAKTVFFIMTDRALDQWMQNQIHFGGQDGIGVFVVGQQNKENAPTWSPGSTPPGSMAASPSRALRSPSTAAPPRNTTANRCRSSRS
jgi:lipid-binding SYLF domain-containing protein